MMTGRAIVILGIVPIIMTIHQAIPSFTGDPEYSAVVAAILPAHVKALLHRGFKTNQTRLAGIISGMRVMAGITGGIFTSDMFPMEITKLISFLNRIVFIMTVPAQGIVSIAIAPLIVVGFNIFIF